MKTVICIPWLHFLDSIKSVVKKGVLNLFEKGSGK